MEVYVGQDELLFSASHGVGEIYKIHGCCSKPNSLVATTADYERFAERNAYLAAKLLTVFAEHPVIFLGYSLNDPNVSDILQSIARCLTTENIAQLRDRLLLVRWDPADGPYRLESSTIVTNGFSIPVRTIATNSFAPIYECLAELPRKFPAPILRRLKEHVYELVHDNDPTDRLYVVDIDDDNVDPSQVKVVYGVGLHVEGGKVRLSSDGDAQPVRLTTDPDAPMLPFRRSLDDSAYATIQDELDALVRAWRTDPLAYIARSRLRAFYAHRTTLELHVEALKCLLVSSMHHHGAPIHYWALKLGRRELVRIIQDEVRLDLYPRIRCAARLAYAVGMTQGEEMLSAIAKSSKHVAVRDLAKRLVRRLSESATINVEYRSPARSRHRVGDEDVTVDIATLFQDPAATERILGHLALETDVKTQTRLKQLDAVFYGTKI